MLIKQNIATKEALSRVFEELQKGSSDSRHPFRYVSLATYDPAEQEPNIRMLVLRGIGSEGAITLYTDERTNKVEELRAHQNSALLFWHDYHKVQLTMKTKVTLHHQNERAEEYWKKDVHGHAQKAYTPLVAPGTSIEEPAKAHSWPDAFHSDHFCVLHCVPFEMEVLQLAGKEHLRIRFVRETPDEEWQGGWIAP